MKIAVNWLHMLNRRGYPQEAVAEDRLRDLGQKVALILVSGLLFSIAIACVGVASRAIAPMPLTILRLAVASLIFCVILFFARPPVRWQPRMVFDLFVIGMGNIGLSFILLPISLRYISSSLASVLFNVAPAITIVLAHFLLPDEKLRPGKIVGTALAISGTVIMVASNASGLQVANDQGWIGQILIILASAAAALALVYTRIRVPQVNTTVLAAGQVFACLAVYLLLGLATDNLPKLETYPTQALAAAIVSAITAPVLGFWLLFYIIKKYSATLGGFTGIATPLFSAIIGILFLGEVLTPTMAISALLMLAGIWVVNTSWKK
jgi:O-acetylserine/cysteine efflux transporter